MLVSLSLSLSLCPFSCDSFFRFAHFWLLFFVLLARASFFFSFNLFENVLQFWIRWPSISVRLGSKHRVTRFNWYIVFFHVLSFWITTPWMVDRFVCCYWPFMHNFHFTPQKPPKKILQESKFINSCPMYARTMYAFSCFFVLPFSSALDEHIFWISSI